MASVVWPQLVGNNPMQNGFSTPNKFFSNKFKRLTKMCWWRLFTTISKSSESKKFSLVIPYKFKALSISFVKKFSLVGNDDDDKEMFFRQKALTL